MQQSTRGRICSFLAASALAIVVGASGCGSSSGGDTGCPAGESLCDSRCIDTQSDPLRCGDCDSTCSLDAPLCELGSCVANCSAGFQNCGGGCVDTVSDRNHCGACGVECGIAEACVNGDCVPGECQGALCDGACVDTTEDPLHCGSCSNACSVSSPFCIAGECVATCPTGLVNCGSYCADLASDLENCGACGQSCGAAGMCVSGICVCGGPGAVDCGGYCAVLSDDPFNCGACGDVCDSGVCVSGQCICTGPGQLDCGGGQCRDITSDPKRCGSCANQCDRDEYCSDSSCECRPELVPDGGGNCRDPASDPGSCGAGATVCGGGMPFCQEGVCVADCSGGPFDECGAFSCVNTDTDPLHCGGCFDVCDVDEVCVNGDCRGFDVLPACTTCPCGACGGDECCTYPGDASVVICVDAGSCP